MDTLPCGHPLSDLYTWPEGSPRAGKTRCNGCRREQYVPWPRHEKTATEFYEQLMAKSTIHPESGCFIYGGYANPKTGYVQIWMPVENGQRRKEYIHRVAWVQFTSQPIPPGHDIDHVKARGCISRACWNLTHLEPVTRAVNLARTKE